MGAVRYGINQKSAAGRSRSGGLGDEIPHEKKEEIMTKQEWNYHPELPIDNNPLFSWPVRWRDALIYYRDGWLNLSEATLFIALAVVVWHWISPNLAAAARWDWVWVGSVWVRNFVILFIVAGGYIIIFLQGASRGWRSNTPMRL